VLHASYHDDYWETDDLNWRVLESVTVCIGCIQHSADMLNDIESRLVSVILRTSYLGSPKTSLFSILNLLVSPGFLFWDNT
jgi:hypothetical protein